MNFDIKSIQIIFSSINWSAIYSAGLTLVYIFGSVLLIYVTTKLIAYLIWLKKDGIFLEVKPLFETEQSPFSTQQFLNSIYSINKQKTLIERLFNLSKRISFEIVSTKTDGIRYLIYCDQDNSELISKSILSYLPGVKIDQAKDYIKKDFTNTSITEFGLSNHFAYPLCSHESLEKSDPIAYLTGNMTRLNKDELIAFQLVSAPISKTTKPDVKKISNQIYSRQDLVKSIDKYGNLNNLLKIFSSLLLQIIFLPFGLIVFAVTGGTESFLIKMPFGLKNKKTSNPYQQELEKLIKQKIDQSLLDVSLRVLVKSPETKNLVQKKRGIVSTICSISGSNYQSLKPILKLKCRFVETIKRHLFKNRLIKPFSKTILSVSEIGDLYHFPFTKTTKTEDLQKQHSKELPTPVSLKSNNQLDVTFGKNTYGGVETPIGLKKEERRKHVYILGGTGTGKSTMLLSMVESDIKTSNGVAVIDPHGDLVEQVLKIIPVDRIPDVVYFNPDDIKYPIGINLLERSKNITEEDSLKEKEYIAESIISLFHKIYTEKYTGPRMEYILRNTIHTAFTVPNATLFTVYKLLVNTRYRKTIVRGLEDENLKDFWRYEFAKAGNYQKVKMISPITNKIGRFLFSPTIKRIIEQEKSTIDFNQIINKKKILLCNLSKGKIGEDNSKVLGSLIMAKLQLAGLKRARIPMKQRKDFYLYVDEFQDFATPGFAQILSEARKYRLNAILAHQTISQIEDKSLVNITLANTGTVICFRTANPEDEKLILPQFKPYIKKGEISSLPSYKFYMRLGALNPEEPFSGITTPIRPLARPEKVKQVIKNSRKKHAIKYKTPQVKKNPNKKEYPRTPTHKSNIEILP